MSATQFRAQTRLLRGYLAWSWRVGVEGFLLFAETVSPRGSLAAAPRGYTPCWQFTSRGLHSSWLANNTKRAGIRVQAAAVVSAPSSSPTRGAKLVFQADSVAWAGSPGAAKRSRFVWLLSLQSGLPSSADRLSSETRIHSRIFTRNTSSFGGAGERADSRLTVRGQCFSCSTQVGLLFCFGFFLTLRRQRRCSRIGTCGVDPGLGYRNQPFAFPSVPSPQWWKLERRRWFSFLAPVQNCRAYFLPAVETPAAQPPSLGSSYLFLLY